MAVPLGGIAKIGVCHPLPVTPDINSDPSSPLTESRGSISYEDEQDEEGVSVDNVGRLASIRGGWSRFLINTHLS